jgi:glycosyltransferase involved in cell wall biosynthesis
LSRRAPEPIAEPFRPVGVKDILFVYDVPSAGARYRSGHLAEQLDLRGASCDDVQSNRVDLVGAVEHYGRFVLNRVRWTEDVAAFLEVAHAARKMVLFDTDDLVFEPELASHLAFMANWPEASRRKEIAELDGYRRTLEAADGVTVSTEPLAEHARRRNERVTVIFNAVSQEMVGLADEALSRSDAPRSEVCIAYFSGTRTHNRDFLEAADAILSTLDSNPHAALLIVGKLDLDERFMRYGTRVRRIGIQPWQALASLYREVDINVAPLERDNPFTECKSCVKYLEAGLLGVPTIASARPDFRRVIEHGRNGLLADSPAEWRTALQQLVDSPSTRLAVGEAAAADVRQNHTTAVRAREVPASLVDL